jgi:hypothetical protein
MTSFDPYDVWATPQGVSVRRHYYAGQLSGKIAALGLGLLDWLIPYLARRITGTNPRSYPIVVAHEVLRRKVEQRLTELEAGEFFQCLRSIAVDPAGNQAWAWGLGFPWMSKNGLYGPEVPFVTHTPYVMEALLTLAEQPALQDKAMALFHGTWGFLESLHVMHEDPDNLALSYAPVDEPRVVVNANAYAAFAYGLHAVHGRDEVRPVAREKAIRLARWVIWQQQTDGAWVYYADQEPGNFIDCFHSCFVVKNLLKVKWLIPEVSEVVMPTVEQGWAYIRSKLYDPEHGLCRRFAKRAQRDPFRWDLYDQAEYLGLLVDFGLLEEAREFRQRVEFRFRKGKHWYCRIDIFGRRWGKDFLRWGIVPFWYHKARLVHAISGRGKKIK